jgi:hypothetical protein
VTAGRQAQRALGAVLVLLVGKRLAGRGQIGGGRLTVSQQLSPCVGCRCLDALDSCVRPIAAGSKGGPRIVEFT